MRGDGTFILTIGGQLVDGLGGHVHEAGEVAAPANGGVELAALVEREGDVFGGERRAVAPGDAGADLDDQLGEIIVVLVALGQPHDLFVGEGAVEGQRLIQEADGKLVVGHGHEGIPLVPLHELALLAAADCNEGLLAGNILDALYGGDGLNSGLLALRWGYRRRGRRTTACQPGRGHGSEAGDFCILQELTT